MDRKKFRRLGSEFPKYAEIVPELKVLAFQATSLWSFKPSGSFCNTGIWYGYFKPRIVELVGWRSYQATEALRTSQAYEAGYFYILSLLPACSHRGRDCRYLFQDPDEKRIVAYLDYIGEEFRFRGKVSLSKANSYSRSRFGLQAGLSQSLRFTILKRDGYRCQLCGASASKGARLEVDHKQPRARGGSDDPENLWTLCFDCNRGKGTKPL
jgi:hypothetical protein